MILENDDKSNYTHDDLITLTTHKYRVRARNGAVESDWSSIKTIRALPSSPTAPRSIFIKSSATSSLVIWEAIPGAKGYDIEINDGLTTWTVEKINKPYFNHRKVKEGQECRYRIRTRNVQGISDWSGIIVNNAVKALCKKNDTLDLGLTAQDVVDFSKYTMIVTYNPGVVDVADLSTKTGEIEQTVGKIEGTYVTVTEFNPSIGRIVFKCSKAIEPDESWPGVINSIKFKSKFKGGTTIAYSVYTEK